MHVYEWGVSEKCAVYESVDSKQDNLLLKSCKGRSPDTWKEIEIVEVTEIRGKPAPKSDFMTTTGFMHLLSENVIEKLGDIFLKYGTLYPLKVKDGKNRVYMYECSNVVDCLDEEKSKIVRSTVNDRLHTRINLPVFDESKVDDNLIFRVPQLQISEHRVYVTEEIKNLVKKNNLKGMYLTKGMFSTEKPWVS